MKNNAFLASVLKSECTSISGSIISIKDTRSVGLRVEGFESASSNESVISEGTMYTLSSCSTDEKDTK
jgi:hypothetical protein